MWKLSLSLLILQFSSCQLDQGKVWLFDNLLSLSLLCILEVCRCHSHVDCRSYSSIREGMRLYFLMNTVAGEHWAVLQNLTQLNELFTTDKDVSPLSKKAMYTCAIGTDHKKVWKNNSVVCIARQRDEHCSILLHQHRASRLDQWEFMLHLNKVTFNALQISQSFGCCAVLLHWLLKGYFRQRMSGREDLGQNPLERGQGRKHLHSTSTKVSHSTCWDLQNLWSSTPHPKYIQQQVLANYQGSLWVVAISWDRGTKFDSLDSPMGAKSFTVTENNEES